MTPSLSICVSFCRAPASAVVFLSGVFCPLLVNVRTFGAPRGCVHGLLSGDRLCLAALRLAWGLQVVEVDFTPSLGPEGGVRNLGRSVWEDILAEAGMFILSAHCGRDFDSYVLSESSLFVYPHNVLLKTCGRSTPFLCLNKLRQYSKVRAG